MRAGHFSYPALSLKGAARLPADNTLLTRAHAYLQIGPFHEVLYGQQTQQQKFVESGLAMLDEAHRREIVAGEQKH